MPIYRTIFILVILSSTALAGLERAPTDQNDKTRDRFTATAVSPGGPRAGGGVAPIDITISRWSSPAEEQQLATALKAKGPDEMLDVLRDLEPVGSIQIPGGLAYELHYAHETRQPGGTRRIVLATDRPVTHWEIATSPRLRDYPFTFIELNVNDEGEGEGELTFAGKIEASKAGDFASLVNYAVQPIQLNHVEKWSR